MLATDLSGPFGSAGDLAHDVQLELPSECASTHVLPSPSFLRSMYRTFPAELPLPHGPVRGVHSRSCSHVFQSQPLPRRSYATHQHTPLLTNQLADQTKKLLQVTIDGGSPNN